jgi:catechol 2,3-dioxygenase-like lactoylglutathione lyase family enzyme
MPGIILQPKGRSVIDHVTIDVSDLARSKAFYADALHPLGYAVYKELEGMVGFAADGKADFWIAAADAPSPLHIAFASPDRETVDRFHAAALAAGGADNGAPGLRPYHPTYYGAYVLDPDGINVEAVHHG